MTVPFSRYDTNMGGGERNKRDKNNPKSYACSVVVKASLSPRCNNSPAMALCLPRQVPQ